MSIVSDDERIKLSREYHRAWRKKNKDKVNASYKAYRKRNPEKTRALHIKWVKKNPVRAAEIARTWRLKNKDKEAEHGRSYRERNLEKVRKSARIRKQAWRRNNLEKVRAENHRRRARIANVENTFTVCDWLDLKARAKYCHWCRAPFSVGRKPTHDHVIPISKGGPNTLENSVCACASCNSRKRDLLINPVNGQGILL